MAATFAHDCEDSPTQNPTSGGSSEIEKNDADREAVRPGFVHAGHDRHPGREVPEHGAELLGVHIDVHVSGRRCWLCAMSVTW